MIFKKEIFEILDARKIIKEIEESEYIPFQKKPAMINFQKNLIKSNAIGLASDLGVASSLLAFYFTPQFTALAATAFSVMAKTYSVYAKDKTREKSTTTRKPYEEMLAKSLMAQYFGKFNDSEKVSYKESVESSFVNTMNSLDYMMGYNFALQRMKNSPNIDSFLQKTRKVYFAAYKKVGSAIDSIMTESESNFINKFIKKPLKKLIPKKFVSHVKNMEEKEKLFDLVERNHNNLNKIKVYTPEREKGPRADREALKKDIDAAIENTYSNSIASGVKWGVSALMADFIVQQRVHKHPMFMPEDKKSEYINNLKYLKDLYGKTKDEKYQIPSLIANEMYIKLKNNEKVDLELLTDFNSSKLKKREDIFLALMSSFDKLAVISDKPQIPEVFSIREEFDKSFRELLRQRGKKIHQDKRNSVELNNLSLNAVQQERKEFIASDHVKIFNPLVNAYFNALDEDKKRTKLNRLLKAGIKFEDVHPDSEFIKNKSSIKSRF